MVNITDKIKEIEDEMKRTQSKHLCMTSWIIWLMIVQKIKLPVGREASSITMQSDLVDRISFGIA